jgi:ribosomal protein L11 methyltransferase
LPPIRVGRLVVSSSPASPTDGSIGIVIRPSMGFGTGHHASTRLCLALLQRVPLAGVSVLDAGTGSGVLAIAAATLGARVVLAVDSDADALTAARESAALNERAGAVELRHLDLSSDLDAMAGHFDVITANLTGAFHERHAGALARRLAAGGHLIASGIQLEEADRVEQAFATRGLVTIERSAEQEWVGFLLRNRVS